MSYNSGSGAAGSGYGVDTRFGRFQWLSASRLKMWRQMALNNRRDLFDSILFFGDIHVFGVWTHNSVDI